MIDLPVHVRGFGDAVVNAFLPRINNLLTDAGLFLGVSNWLLKGGAMAFPGFHELTRNGSLILLHAPMYPVDTWEGLNFLFRSVDDVDSLERGFFKTILQREGGYFDHVTFGVLVYKKGGKRGWFTVRNDSCDAELLNHEALGAIRSIAETNALTHPSYKTASL